MRRLLGGCLLVFALGSCTANESSTEVKVDSTINNLDSAAHAIFDSTKEAAKDIKENLDSTFDRKKDTIHK